MSAQLRQIRTCHAATTCSSINCRAKRMQPLEAAQNNSELQALTRWFSLPGQPWPNPPLHRLYLTPGLRLGPSLGSAHSSPQLSWALQRTGHVELERQHVELILTSLHVHWLNPPLPAGVAAAPYAKQLSGIFRGPRRETPQKKCDGFRIPSLTAQRFP